MHMRALPVTRWLLLGAVLAGLTQRGAAQEMALATRAPRFLFAASSRAAPVEVDGSSNLTLRRVVSLNLEQPTVGRLLSAMERQTGLRFAYSRDVLDPDRPVALRAETITVGAALLSILMDTGVDVVLSSGAQVSLVERAKVVADTGAVAGRVTDKKTGAAIAGATVVVEGTRQGATTGNDGRYRIGEVAAGTYTVRTRYIGYAPASGSVTVAGNGEATADFALEKSAQRLNEVVTTGTVVPTEIKALPTPVSIITSEDIELQHPRNVQQVLRQAVPTAVGWDLPNLPAQTAFSTRGSTALTAGGGQMKVYIDGIESASFTAAGVDPSSIDRIEVIRGPEAAAIYGSDAIDGVIQVFTKRGDVNSGPHIDAQAALGVQQTPYDGFGGVLRQNYSAAIRGGAPEASYNFGAGYSRLADYVPDGEISRQSSPSVYGGARFTRGIVSFDASGRYFSQNDPSVQNPEIFQTGFVPVSKPSFQPTQFQSTTLGARLTVAPITWWENRVTVGMDRLVVDQSQVKPRLTTPTDTLLSVFTELESKLSIGFNSTLKGQLGAGLQGQITAGFDHYSQPVSVLSALTPTPTGTLQNVFASKINTNNTGYFAQAQIGIRDALFLTGGLRAEENTNFGDSLGTPVSPRVGASFVQEVGSTTLKVRGSWGRAIRAPSPGDKLGQTSPVGVVLSNPTLGPERQHGWDAGMDAAFGNRGSIGITYYNQIAEDLIESVSLGFTPVPTAQFENVGRVKNTGVEVEGTLAIGIARLRAQYGYASAKIEDLGPNYQGDQLVGEQTRTTPKHTAGASLALSPLAGTTIGAGMTYVGSWDSYDYLLFYRCFAGTAPCPPSFLTTGSTRDFVIKYPSFVKLNLTVFQRITPLVSGFVSVDNLTNNEATEFTNFIPSVGRTTTAGLQLHY
jgi:outer membrane receptor protein involved in Fe transport